MFGGIVGSALLKSILPPEFQFGMGAHGLNPGMTVSTFITSSLLLLFTTIISLSNSLPNNKITNFII